MIILGLISVMLLFAVTVARRKSGQVQLLTIVDQTQIARFFLESYAGDILNQLRLHSNTPGTTAFDEFRKAGSGERTFTLTPDLYQPSYLLQDLKKRYDIEFEGSPVIKVASMTILPYPSCLEVPQKVSEKKGNLYLEIRAKFRERIYQLRVRYPAQLVMYMTPLLKEFVLFFDRLNLEQPEPFGAKDNLNILYTKRSDHPTKTSNEFNLSIPSDCEKFSGKPWLLMPTQGGESNFDKNGRVFFGQDSSKIYLNLAGEMHFRGFDLETNQSDGAMTDLWFVPSQAFVVNTNKTPVLMHPFDTRPGNLGMVTFRCLNIKHPTMQYITRQSFVGFSAEIDDLPDGNFLNPNFSMNVFLSKDPSFQKLAADRKHLKLASPFKLYGLSYESNGNAGPPPPSRQIFGNVFSRFFKIAVWESSLGPRPLHYVPEAIGNSSFRPPPAELLGQSEPWDPSLASESYSDYMSTTVSGGDPGSAQAPQMAYNLEGAIPKMLSYRDFCPADGVKMKGPFSDFAADYYGIKNSDPGLVKKSVLSRICRYFPDQESFKKYAGLSENPPHFWVDGIMYIKGPLDLPDLTFANVRGGVVLVDGPIKLGNITRGLPDLKTSAGMDAMYKLIKDLKQREFLTFVSLEGSQITLKEDYQVGVQVISLKPGISAPENQIKWEKGQNVVFVGGVAVSTPKVIDRIKDFKETPFFFFAPTMASSTPEMAVYLAQEMETYEMFVE